MWEVASFFLKKKKPLDSTKIALVFQNRVGQQKMKSVIMWDNEFVEDNSTKHIV